MLTDKISLIGRRILKINDKITIRIPTLNQLRDNAIHEETIDNNLFWQEINLFIQTPSDNISELDSIGIDFEQISEYLFFLLMFQTMRETRKGKESVLFIGLDFWNLEVSGTDVLTLNDKDGVVIDENMFNKLSSIIAYMTCREKTKPKKFGNTYAKKKRIEQDYKKKAKHSNNEDDNKSDPFDGMILRLVCNANFPYDFQTIGNVSLFEFIYSIKQIDKDMAINDLMTSRFYGNDLRKIPLSELSRYVI